MRQELISRWMMIECSSLSPHAKTHRNELRESKRPFKDGKQFNDFSVSVIVCFIALFVLFLPFPRTHNPKGGGEVMSLFTRNSLFF